MEPEDTEMDDPLKARKISDQKPTIRQTDDAGHTSDPDTPVESESSMPKPQLIVYQTPVKTAFSRIVAAKPHMNSSDKVFSNMGRAAEG